MYELNTNFVKENKYHFNRLNVHYVGVSGVQQLGLVFSLRRALSVLGQGTRIL